MRRCRMGHRPCRQRLNVTLETLADFLDAAGVAVQQTSCALRCPLVVEGPDHQPLMIAGVRRGVMTRDGETHEILMIEPKWPTP